MSAFSVQKKTRHLIQGAIIAALYAVLTILLQPISFGLVQFRVSEALVVLPFFTPAAVPGLFIGCLIANLIGGFGIYDIVLGSIATLIAAYVTYKIKKPILVPLPAVIANGLIVGLVLYLVGFPYLESVLWVGLGELVCAYVLGLPLLFVLKKYQHKIFN